VVCVKIFLKEYNIMNLSLTSIFSKKNVNLVVGLLSLLVVLWLIMFAIPSLFYNLFDTGLGNLILIVFLFLAGMYDLVLAVGLAIIFIILYQFSHMH
jgi:hypothetical protein